MTEHPVSPEVALRVGIVALHALPAIDSSAGRAIGGTETRAWLLARGLAAAGHAVVLVVRSPTAFERTVNDVTVVGIRDRLFERYLNVGRSLQRDQRGWRLKAFNARLPFDLLAVVGHRMVSRRKRNVLTTHIARRLPVERADTWLTFGVQANSADVISACKPAAKPTLLMLGCDADVDGWYASEPERRTPYGDRGAVCDFILRSASRIVAQTDWQADALRERYSREAALLPNPIDLSRWARPISTGEFDDLPSGFVLWVGRAEPVHKRPAKAIEIATHCRETPFVVVLNPADPATEAAVRDAAPANVTFLSYVPPEKMPELMHRATLLLNTSSTEGFPNVFLQAAAAQTPIVSLAVLADWLERSGSGVCCGDDVDRAAGTVRELLGDAERRSAIGRSAQAFVTATHGLPPVVETLSQIIAQTAGGRTS